MAKKSQRYLTRMFLFVLLSFLSWGCSYFEAPNAMDHSGTFSSNGTNVELGKATVGVLSSRRLLKGMQACLGLAEVSSAAEQMWKRKQGSLSVNGEARSVTAPMLMAHAELAGELCQQLVTEEKNRPAVERRIFRHVEFSSSFEKHSENQMADVIRRLARSCWGRNESARERDIILDELRQNFSEEDSVEPALVFSCSAMLASLSGSRI